VRERVHQTDAWALSTRSGTFAPTYTYIIFGRYKRPSKNNGDNSGRRAVKNSLKESYVALSDTVLSSRQEIEAQPTTMLLDYSILQLAEDFEKRRLDRTPSTASMDAPQNGFNGISRRY